MSQHIIKMYNKIDKQLKKAPTTTKSTGLISKRDAPTTDTTVAKYVKKIRDMREGSNAAS